MLDEISEDKVAATNGGDGTVEKIENNNVDIDGEKGGEPEPPVTMEVGDEPTEETAEGVDAEKEEVEAEGEGEEQEKTFLDDINLVEEEKEDEEEEEEGTGKVADKMIERKAVIINIDKTKTNDEIEDYLFDNYPEGGIQSFKVIRRIPYRVIVVFESKDKLAEFLSGPEMNDLIGFKNKMKKLALAEFRSQAAERRKVHEKIAEGLLVSCEGFEPAETTEAILAYMKDNHSEVSQVEKKEDGKVVLTFPTKSAATGFVGLSYVKCRGRTISRTVLVAVQKFKTERKPLVNGTNELNRKRKMTNTKESGSSFKLKGFQNKTTTYKTIQETLQVLGLNVQFVRYMGEKGEALVTLRSGNVSQVLEMFKKRPVFINKDKMSAEVAQFGPPENVHNKPKRFKSSDNLQMNKIRAWTHY